MTTTETKISPAETLNELLTRAYDAEQGYQVAAEAAENEALKEWFAENSKQRLSFGHALKGHLASLSVEPDRGASVEGKIHQAFIKLRTMIHGDNDLALIEECRRGEETAMLDYQAALKNEKLTALVVETLRRQGSIVLDQLSALDSIEAALRKA